VRRRNSGHNQSADGGKKAKRPHLAGRAHEPSLADSAGARPHNFTTGGGRLFPLIVAAGAYLVSLFSSAWDRKAKVVAAIVVIGTSAVLTVTDLVCFGFLPPLGCFYPLTSIDKWPFVMFVLQFTLPYVLWAVVGRWARRSGRAGPKSVDRIGGW
jgi:hypothetical protein